MLLIVDTVNKLLESDELVTAFIFSATRAYIYGMIRNFGLEGFGNIQRLLLATITVYFTLWFMYQGWRIATGRSRESMMQFVQRTATTTFIIWIALLGVNKSANIIDFIDGLQSIVTTAIAGDDYKNPEKMVDTAMLTMQLMSNLLEEYVTEGNKLSSSQALAANMGIAIPALIAGGLLLLNKIALYLCVMFAPLCLIACIFEQTRFMFTAWVKFTAATLFLLAVITIIAVIAMKALLFVAATLILAEITGGADLKSIATAQGGLGMLLTTLIVGVPPIVTNFFNGQVTAALNTFNPVGSLARGDTAGSREEAVQRTVIQNTQPKDDQVGDNERQQIMTGGLSATSPSYTPLPPGTHGNANKDPE